MVRWCFSSSPLLPFQQDSHQIIHQSQFRRAKDWDTYSSRLYPLLFLTPSEHPLSRARPDCTVCHIVLAGSDTGFPSSSWPLRHLHGNPGPNRSWCETSKAVALGVCFQVPWEMCTLSYANAASQSPMVTSSWEAHLLEDQSARGLFATWLLILVVITTNFAFLIKYFANWKYFFEYLF